MLRNKKTCRWMSFLLTLAVLHLDRASAEETPRYTQRQERRCA